MPVRCGTGYRKPYKVIWTDPKTGKVRRKAFHWLGPAEHEVETIRVFYRVQAKVVKEGEEFESVSERLKRASATP